MNDAEYEEQVARLKAIRDRWHDGLLGAFGFDVTWRFHRDRHDMPEDSREGALAACKAHWPYLRASVHWYMPEVAASGDEYLELAIVHEMYHVLVNEMREEGIEHEERVVTMLTTAALWIRDHAEGLKAR